MSMIRILAAGLLALSMAGCLGQASEDEGSQPSPFTPPPANQAPSIGSLPAQNSVTAGSMLSLQPSASDPDNDPLTFEVANRPGWASFDASSGRLWGTPTDANVGTYSNIRISVRDAAHVTAGNAFSIVVNPASAPPPANRSPVISGTPAPSVTEGAAYSFTPTASDPDGNALTFSITGRPAWASFDTANGRLSGTPGTGSAGAYANIQISVSDGSLSATLAAFTITVLPANRAPVIGGTPAATVIAGQAYSFTPTASDPDGNALSFSIVNRPGWAMFNTSTGRLSGTPTPAQAAQYVDIRITVSDGMASATLPAFTITVETGNRAPTISGTPATTIVEGQAYSFTPTASDADGDTLSFTITNRPSWATFNAATGSLSGTPGAGSVGTYPNIQIRVSDGTVEAALPAFSITVQQAASGSATLSWNAPTTRTDGSPLTDLAGYRLRYGNSSGNYPNTITISNPGLTSYVVNNLASGTWFFVLAAYDSAGLESSNTNPVSKTIP